MKKSMALPMMLVLAATFAGCATSREMEKVQADQQLIDTRVAQALQDAQAAKEAADGAKEAADAAKLQADAATARAEEVEKAALERERIAEERAAQDATAAFAESMRK